MKLRGSSFVIFVITLLFNAITINAYFDYLMISARNTFLPPIRARGWSLRQRLEYVGVHKAFIDCIDSLGSNKTTEVVEDFTELSNAMLASGILPIDRNNILWAAKATIKKRKELLLKMQKNNKEYRNTAVVMFGTGIVASLLYVPFKKDVDKDLKFILLSTTVGCFTTSAWFGIPSFFWYSKKICQRGLKQVSILEKKLEEIAQTTQDTTQQK